MPADQESINRDLREKPSFESEFQKKLIQRGKEYMKASCDAMSELWEVWDEYDKIYRGYRVLDRKDKKSASKKEPVKMIVPTTYAQAQTGISFLYTLFNQRDHFYELKAGGPEDEPFKLGMELDLSYQLRRGRFPVRQYGFLQDAFKYGFGVLGNSWETEETKLRTRVPIDPGVGGIINKFLGRKQASKFEEQVNSFVSFEGNSMENISPYNWYPDPGVPLAQFQDGEFCAHEKEINMMALKSKENKKYFGLKHVKNFTPSEYTGRKRRAGQSFNDSDVRNNLLHKDTLSKQVVVTQIQLSIIPADWTKKYKINFGSETYPIKFIMEMINDNKIIRFEPMGNLHGKFAYDIIEYSPDHNMFSNPGLSETVFYLQDTISWFINSHIANVKNALINRFIANPEQVYIEDIESGRAAIRTKGVSLKNIDSAIKQLQTTDVTRGHIGDIDSLNGIIQQVTGINETAMGQMSSGRRSAKEAGGVQAAAARRITMHGKMMWEQGFVPLAETLIANTRQGRSEEMYNNILGSKAESAPYEEVIFADPARIAGAYDFIPFDGTLPSDKERKAGLLGDLFKSLIAQPEMMQILNKNPLPLLNRIFELQGISNLGEFDLPDMNRPVQAEVMPDDQALEEAERQGAQPVDLSGQQFLQGLQ